MRLVNTKVDGVDSMPAANYNAQRDELENAVLSADITLDADAGPDTDLNMLGKTMGAYANAGNVYQDSGAANTYVLSLTTNLKTVAKYYDNMMVIFKAGNANTGASTINVNTLGAKSFTLSDGTALAAGNVSGGRYMLAAYSLSNDRFELVTGAPASSLEYNVYIHATDGDYPTLAAYLASVPVAGDSVLYDADETIAAGVVIPADISIAQVFGRTMTITASVTTVIELESSAKLKGRFDLAITGTVANAILLNGSNSDIDDLKISGAGTVTNIANIVLNTSNCFASISVSNSVTVTNYMVDNSTLITNDVSVMTGSIDDQIARSAGASDFGAGTFTQNSATGLTLSGVLATKVTVDLGTVTQGDIFTMQSYLTATKGGTTGTCQAKNAKFSGVATVETLDGSNLGIFGVAIDLSTLWQFPISTMFKVTGSGTLVMQVLGASNGSNSTSGSVFAGVSFLRRQ